MRNLNDTLSRLARLRRLAPQAAPANDRLQRMGAFGSNPGDLSAWTYVPASARPGAPLVVVLHGCTQNAAGYDDASGWSRMADQHGFMLLYPEQQRGNNPNLCFNWFSEADSSRDRGEALSIRQMVAAMVSVHGADPARVFVTGLSAGGAMTAVMLATYPEVFAGGAVIAGLPFGVARSVPQAFDRMRGHGGPSPAALTALVKKASGHDGEWPTLSVWHGSGDQTVDPSNAAALVEQWRSLHRATPKPSEEDLVDGYPHRVWRDPQGRAVIEEYSITGMAHGTPLDASGPESTERVAPFMLDAGISSTRLIGHFWGIVPRLDRERDSAVPERPAPIAARIGGSPKVAQRGPQFISRTIEKALRSAGLMR